FRARQAPGGAAGAAPAAQLHAFGVLLAEELARIEHAAVPPDFEMHVGTGGTPGRARPGDLLAAAHQVADLHFQPRVVRVAGDVAVAVVDLDHLAVARAPAREADHAVGDCQDRIAGAGMEIDALVEAAAAAERIGPAAVAGGDVGIEDRHARGRRAAVELAVEQQRFEHRQLLARVGQLHAQFAHAVAQVAGGHVAHRAFAADANRLVEVELAVAE